MQILASSWENQQCGFWPGLTQTRLYSYWRWLEAWNFVLRYWTIQVAKIKRWSASRFKADLRLCFRISRLLVFSWCGSYLIMFSYGSSYFYVYVIWKRFEHGQIIVIDSWVVWKTVFRGSDGFRSKPTPPFPLLFLAQQTHWASAMVTQN